MEAGSVFASPLETIDKIWATILIWNSSRDGMVDGVGSASLERLLVALVDLKVDFTFWIIARIDLPAMKIHPSSHRISEPQSSDRRSHGSIISSFDLVSRPSMGSPLPFFLFLGAFR